MSKFLSHIEVDGDVAALKGTFGGKVSGKSAYVLPAIGVANDAYSSGGIESLVGSSDYSIGVRPGYGFHAQGNFGSYLYANDANDFRIRTISGADWQVFHTGNQRTDGANDSRYALVGRQITINGVSQDLSVNQNWEVGTIRGGGPVNSLPYFDTTGSIAASNIRYLNDSGWVGFGGIDPEGPVHFNGNAIFEGQLVIRLTGYYPLYVESSIMCPNLNAEYLQGQHGAYYLDWNNFTNKPSIPSLSGYALESWVNTYFYSKIDVDAKGFATSSSSNTFTNKAGNISMWSNNSGYITGAALSGYALESWTNTYFYSRVDIDNKGYTSNNGTVTQVGFEVPSGFDVLSSPVTGSGNLKFGFSSGYSLVDNSDRSNWNSGIKGSGANGYMAKWSGSGYITDSRIYDSGSGLINISTGVSIFGGIALYPRLESQLSSIPGLTEGMIAYVARDNGSGGVATGHGLWCYYGPSVGWRIIATRVWVGNPASGAP